MKYEGIYSCGHEGVINKEGRYKDNIYGINRKFEGPCPACWAQEQLKKAQEQQSELSLPDLAGTEKQIEYGLSKRMQVMGGVVRKMRLGDTKDSVKEKLRLGLEWALENRRDAKFWIEADWTTIVDVYNTEILEIPENIAASMPEIEGQPDLKARAERNRKIFLAEFLEFVEIFQKTKEEYSADEVLAGTTRIQDYLAKHTSTEDWIDSRESLKMEAQKVGRWAYADMYRKK